MSFGDSRSDGPHRCRRSSWLPQAYGRSRCHEKVTQRTRQQTVASHRKLLQVIRSGDAERAATEARRHVDGWRKLLPASPAGAAGDH
ncbi:MAG: FCD domain-containing protein [Planctomycetia bacterium]|nr:FCD domain-containing protein [Planctomycetia bacterium]